MEEMTGRERYQAILRGEETDRPAAITVVSVATEESCSELGIRFEETHLCADKMAALSSYIHTELGFDSVMPYYSVVQEAAALGGDINWGDGETMPYQNGRCYGEPEEFQMPEDFLDRLPIKTVLDSIRLLKKKHGDTAVITGKAMGPWTLTMRLYGLEDLLVDSLLEPDKIKAFMGRFVEITKKFVQAQLEAGADLVTIADHTTSNLVSPQTYVEFAQPLHQELNRLFPGKLVLHCCGNTMDRISHFKDGGFPVFHFESSNDIREALRLAGPMKLAGCINNPDVLLAGSPETVDREVRRIVDAGIRLISPECAVPLQTKNANMAQIVKTLKTYSK